MNNKRIFALVFSAIMIFSLSACGDKNEGVNAPQEDVTESIVEETTSEITQETESDDTEDTEEKEETTIVEEDTEETAVTEETTASSNNPADWSTEKIVKVYKEAAKKSDSTAKSNQKITLTKISVNNGEYDDVFDFITPVMSKLLSNNSKVKNGITGGYNNLMASDVASAKAYKSGKNTVVEMVMKNQVSGIREDAFSGSVGHAITAVGDIGVVVTQLKDLGIPLEPSEKDTKIIYTNPVVKVVIDENGKIINGTWSYDVEIKMNNYKAFGQKVEKTSVIMDNRITVNGGFKK